jgi:hypothetical protein
MKQLKQKDTCREWMSVPCPGSVTHAIASAFWNRIAAHTCAHCNQPIGYGVGIYLYQPRQVPAHIYCTDKAEAAGIALRSSAGMVDAAAKLAGITQTGFRALAVWEQDRLIADVLSANRPTVGPSDCLTVQPSNRDEA